MFGVIPVRTSVDGSAIWSLQFQNGIDLSLEWEGKKRECEKKETEKKERSGKRERREKAEGEKIAIERVGEQT